MVSSIVSNYDFFIPGNFLLTDFSQSFASGYYTRAEWLVLGDKSLMCRFLMEDGFYKAYYTQKGEWMGTLTSYDGSKLNRSIYDKVKSTYYDYKIIFVNQIDLVRNKIIYIVEIRK